MEFTQPAVYYYKRALQYLEETIDGQAPNTGMCHALVVACSLITITDQTDYADAVTDKPGIFDKVQLEITEDGLFREIYRFKPINASGFWFPNNEHGRQIRLSILRIAIERELNMEIEL